MTRIAGVLLLVSLVGGCQLFTGPDEPDRLEEARELWARVGPSDYSYDFTPQCFCPLGGQRIRVTVDDGVVSAARLASNDSPLTPSELSSVLTIPELFDLIEDAIDRKADRIEASYDGTYGYPVHVGIDYVRTAIDDEYGFTVTAFASLEILGTGR